MNLKTPFFPFGSPNPKLLCVGACCSFIICLVRGGPFFPLFPWTLLCWVIFNCMFPRFRGFFFFKKNPRTPQWVGLFVSFFKRLPTQFWVPLVWPGCFFFLTKGDWLGQWRWNQRGASVTGVARRALGEGVSLVGSHFPTHVR